MTHLVAHQAGPLSAHDLWSRWNADPALVAALLAVTYTYARGARLHRRAADRWRAACLWGGVSVLVVALASPLHAISGELASAHMVQHLLLVLVAAPLLASSAPLTVLVAGLPPRARATARRARRRTADLRRSLRAGEPLMAWLVHAAVLWFWHASVPYGAALDSHVVHMVEHVTFLLSAVWFWSVVVRPRHVPEWSHGHAALLVFAMAVHAVLLAALLTFATSPWYDGYSERAARWGVDPLADQQLAGAIMWVPGGLVYVATGVVLIGRWVRAAGAGRDGDLPGDWEGGLSRRPLRITRLH